MPRKSLIAIIVRVRTHVYIDGFNLYYGAIRGTRYHWLDLDKMCRLLLPENQILSIRYCTAIVSARPGDPDKPNRKTFISGPCARFRTSM